MTRVFRIFQSFLVVPSIVVAQRGVAGFGVNIALAVVALEASTATAVVMVVNDMGPLP
jgi:hypothetical protein